MNPPSAFLSCELHEDILAHAVGNLRLIADKVHNLTVCLLIEALGSVLNGFSAGEVAFAVKTVAVDIQIAVLNVELERVDAIGSGSVALPCVVIGEGDGTKATNLHNLLDSTAVLFLLIIQIFHFSSGIKV